MPSNERSIYGILTKDDKMCACLPSRDGDNHFDCRIHSLHGVPDGSLIYTACTLKLRTVKLLFVKNDGIQKLPIFGQKLNDFGPILGPNRLKCSL